MRIGRRCGGLGVGARRREWPGRDTRDGRCAGRVGGAGRRHGAPRTGPGGADEDHRHRTFGDVLRSTMSDTCQRSAKGVEPLLKLHLETASWWAKLAPRNRRRHQETLRLTRGEVAPTLTCHLRPSEEGKNGPNAHGATPDGGWTTSALHDSNTRAHWAAGHFSWC